MDASGTAEIIISPVLGDFDCSFINRRWTGSFEPCEIKSIRLDCLNRSVKEVNLLEEDIQVSYFSKYGSDYC
jgi:hypothetical protein